jgi:two-component system OmpR family sensor kinase
LTLRARLVAGLIAVAALGLLALGGITYWELASFESERVNEQVRAAQGPMSFRLAEKRGEADPGPRGGGGPRGSFNLPPGTYGELRDGDGDVLVRDTFSYDTDYPTPDLPESIPLGTLLTVDAEGDSDVSFRVLAQESPRFGGGMIVTAVPLTESERTLDRLLLVEGIVIAGVLIAVGGLGWTLVGVGLRPLERMAGTADDIAAGDLSRRVSPATDRTEVGRLGLALNAMLARLERAFSKQEASEQRLRRFLADASHELRTPLASIRGYAELHRMGAAASPAETEKAMRRIEDEARRMGVLVQDLLTLARLDEVRDAERTVIDLAELARDATDDAQVTDPTRAIALHGDAEPALVLGDGHQLRQVLANLLRNALVHTPAGTPIEVSVGEEDGTVRVEVRDHGPGLPPGDPDALFERFWRAEAGRERGRAGAGLGLAIVAGIVGAHHGEVHAANAPDGGARFFLTLPRVQDAMARPASRPLSRTARPGP